MAYGDVIARLSVELGLDSASFETGAKRAGRATDDLGDRAERLGQRVGSATKAIAVAGLAVAGSFVIGQVKEMITTGLEYASSLGEQAQQLGVTTKTLQQYRYAASQTGIEQSEMDKGLQKLTRTIGLAANGNKAASAAFTALGVDVRDSNGQVRDAGELLPLIAEALSKIPDPARRAAAETALFGRAGQQLDPLLSQGRAGVEGLTKAASDLGLVLSDDMIARADDAADKLSALNQVLQAKIAAAVAENAGEIVKLVNALIQLVKWSAEGIRAWRLFWNGFTSAQVGNPKSLMELAVEDLGPKVQINPETKGASARRLAPGAAPGAVPAFLRKRTTSTPYRFGTGPTKFAANDIEVDAGRNTQALAALKAMADQAETSVGRLSPVLTKLDAEVAKATDSFAKLGPIAQSIMDRLFPDEAANRQFEADLAALRKEFDKGTISVERYDEARRRLSLSSVGLDPVSDYGFGDTIFADVGPLEVGVDRVQDALDRMSEKSAITTTAVNDNFRDMADATLAALDRMAGAVRGGGFLDILSAVIGLGTQLGSIGVFGKAVQGRINTPPIKGYATGTRSAARGLALVGERGPELVNFRGGERVYRAGESRDMMGGGIAQILPSPYFDVVVDGRVARAAPTIARGGAQIAGARAARSQKWRIG